MKFWRPFARDKRKQFWAGLCTARADGTNDSYRSGAKHALLTMVCATEPEVESKIIVLLAASGWREPVITNLKLLTGPFETEDRDIQACFKAAGDGPGGIIVYSDEIDS
jgi:hypothetical protein